MQEDPMQSILTGQRSYIPVIVLIIAIAAILLILLFLKVYQVKHGSGKKYRPEPWNAKPPGRGSAQRPGNAELKRGELSERKQVEDNIQLSDLGRYNKKSPWTCFEIPSRCINLIDQRRSCDCNDQ